VLLAVEVLAPLNSPSTLTINPSVWLATASVKGLELMIHVPLIQAEEITPSQSSLGDALTQFC